MQYDRLGFPIPKEFEASARHAGPPSGDDRPPNRFDSEDGDRAPPRAWRRYFLLGVLLLGVVPVLLMPNILPLIREWIIDGAVTQAMVAEGRGDVAAAARHVGRALSWVDGDAGLQEHLLCWRSTLRLQDRDVRGAIADAGAAAMLAPRSARPLRTRAIAHVVAVDGHGRLGIGQHRVGGESPEFLDTRGFLLHQLGRQHEAIDDLNRAIAGMQQSRRELVRRIGNADPAFVAWRLRPVEQALAVMHQHRALACRAAGLAAQAAQDFEVAQRKGFAPERGVL